MSNPLTEEQQSALKSARTFRRVGIYGALLLIGGFAWMSFVVRGEISWLVIIAAAFAGGCHWMGCEVLARNYAAQAKVDTSQDTPNA